MNTATLDATAVRRWNRYPEYRASGAEWFAGVPTHWQVRRLKFLTTLNPSKTEVSHVSDTTEVSFLPMERVGEDGSLSLELNRPIGDIRQGFTYFRDGDILVAKITPCFENGKGALASGLTNGVGFGTTEFHVLRPRPEIDGRYLELVTRLHAFREQGVSEMFGAAGQQRVPQAFLSNYLAPLPPLSEQRAIAAFLDRETARIDALVGHKERLIALLEEKRQAVISHAVTRGLDPTAPLKDSGVPWLGMVPAHWKLLPIGWLAEVSNGATPSQARLEYWEDGDTPWVASGEVNEEIVTNPTALITSQAARDTGLRMIPKGSILLGMIGQGRTRGMSTILGIDACINQNVAAITPRSVLNGEYLRYSLMHAYEPIRQVGRGGQQGALNCELIRDIRILVPPIEEQRQIASYLNQQGVRTGQLIDLLSRHNDMLREHRTALISAAVTGQIDVRGGTGT